MKPLSHVVISLVMSAALSSVTGQSYAVSKNANQQSAESSSAAQDGTYQIDPTARRQARTTRQDRQDAARRLKTEYSESLHQHQFNPDGTPKGSNPHGYTGTGRGDAPHHHDGANGNHRGTEQ